MAFFEKAFLDSEHWSQFERMAISEGYICASIEGEPLDENNSNTDYWTNSHNSISSDILIYLTLFDSIAGPETYFDLNNLSSLGIVNKEEINADIENFIPNQIYFEAAELIEKSKGNLIESIIGDIRPAGKWRKTAIMNAVNVLLDDPIAFSRQMDIDLSEMEYQVQRVYLPVVKAIYSSANSGSTVVSRLASNSEPFPVEPIELVDELYYLVQTRLNDQVIYLPKPSSIDHALEVRNFPEMVDFRLILNEWIEYIRDGGDRGVEKIDADLKLANRSLRRIENIIEFQQSPINFWINTIGGHIPFVSNVITVANTFASGYSMYGQRKYRWATIFSNSFKKSSMIKQR
ncbi:hypothetical protein WKI13_13200 [Teredinibacter turnerae]|uniref:hypothetical protein n=1 Tax=Teredinibacter turnerae TaxID=2426 RepID=UPI0003784ADD|nr:hypothetical protein [Teredinibacter turnerae]